MWLHIHFLWLPQLYVRKLILLHQQMNTISYQFEQLGESFPNGTIQQSQRQNKRDNVSKDCTRTNDTVQHKLKNLNKKWFNQRNIYLQLSIRLEINCGFTHFTHHSSKVWGRQDLIHVYSPRLHLFNQKYNKNSNIVKCYSCITIASIWIKVNCSFDDKAEFSVSLLQYSVSHDPFEIILICWFGAH